MARDERFISLALKIAAKSAHPIAKIGCVMVNGNRVISIGINRHKTHPKQLSHHCSGQYAGSIHAELDAILSGEAKGCTLYVARVMADGSSGLAKPCHICETICMAAGIKKIVFTNYNSHSTMFLESKTSQQNGLVS